MTIVRRLAAAALTAHATAQLAGFVWPWWVLEPLPSKPDHSAMIGDVAMQATSVLWLGVAIAFLIAALEVLRGARGARRVTAGAAVASLVLSAVCWPGSVLGVPINLAILAVLRQTRTGSSWSRRKALGSLGLMFPRRIPWPQ